MLSCGERRTFLHIDTYHNDLFAEMSEGYEAQA